MEEMNINNYLFDGPLTNANSGFSKWAIGCRGANRYFVKEFLSPTYPEDMAFFNEEQWKARYDECVRFEEEKKELYGAINQASDGHLMRIIQFFRVKAKYYMVTDAVEGRTLSVKEIARLSYRERLTICCAVAHAISLMHAKGIVHADIKPDNILVTKKLGLGIHIIDFDCSFFEEKCPAPGEELNGDLVYLSPEAFLHMAGLESSLSCKMDVFALGLVFHQYLTGSLPQKDEENYLYSYEAVLDGNELKLEDDPGTKRMESILLGMLQKEPDKRPDMKAVFEAFHEELLAECGRTNEKPAMEKSAAGKPVAEESVEEKPADLASAPLEAKQDAQKKDSFFMRAGDL